LVEWLRLSDQCNTDAICYFDCIFDSNDKFAYCASDGKRGIIKPDQEHKNERINSVASGFSGFLRKLIKCH